MKEGNLPTMRPFAYFLQIKEFGQGDFIDILQIFRRFTKFRRPDGTTSSINKQFVSIDSCSREHYH